MDQWKIAVIGGGPGGLVAARILKMHGVDVTVFERDLGSDARWQGGTLDMHVETGQYAFRVAGLEKEFLALARYEDQGNKLYDRHGRLLVEETGEEAAENDRPELDRGHLRQILVESLPEGVIRWGSVVTAVEGGEGGRYRVIFEEGEEESFDLVIGADGAWSRVRPLVSKARPEYSGVLFLEFALHDVDEKLPEIAAMVGRGKMMAVDGKKGIIAQRNANAHVRVYVMLRVAEDWSAKCGIDEMSKLGVSEYIAEVFAGWSDELLAMIQKGEFVAARPIYALPVGHGWENRPGVTLVGDAAHLMSPFSGEGANLAMRDGADLALAIAQGADWKTAVREFEETMFERAAEAAIGAKDGIDGVCVEGDLESALEHMQAHRAEA